MALHTQYILVAIIVAAAAFGAVKAFSGLFRDKHNSPPACAGCPLAPKCDRTNQNSPKKCDKNVAQSRK